MKIKAFTVTAVCFLVMPVIAMADENKGLSDNAAERVQEVFNKTCHIPSGMAKALILLLTAVVCTVIYYFICVKTKGDQNE